MTFKTFRPAALLIERSYDFGNTWQVYRYFAYDCAEAFPGISRDPPRNLTEVICESRYSNVAPSTEGEVIFRVLPPNLPIDDPYSQQVQNLLKMTNLRINFTKLHTLGDDLLDNRQEIQEKYYYSMYDMVVRGSCSCYGHASRCLPLPGVDTHPHSADMVHGRCECTHNTKGLNCEKCEDFYNDLPWRPAIGRQTNACKRCNCNNHTDRCHYDPAVYEATGRISGGVCDDCEHNTMGRNCEQCKPFYYADPTKEAHDPDVCVECDCDPRGSIDDGICDSRDNLSNGVTAGQCHCKRNVQGRRCDQCQQGFWNFTESNPDGCERCGCNLLGTYENQGCNVFSGECVCKRYVTGRDCDQCLPEHWGLSDTRDGCKPCDCDPGGSYDNMCDVITGQCKCRPHVNGRTCSQPEQGFFAGLLDYRIYEAEYGGISDKAQLLIREPYRDRDPSWTGLGFVRAVEDSSLEFKIDGITQSMEYDIVIRYEPQLAGQWEDVRLLVDRPDGVDIDGPCANHGTDQEEIYQVSLPSGARHAVVYPSVCLEVDKNYKFRLEFNAYDRLQETPSASVLIDSITVVPRADSVPFLTGSLTADQRRQEFEHYRCAQYFYSVVKANIPDVCRKHLYSIGFYVLGSGYECQCDPTGSKSGICDSLGGQCQCKPNVVGRRCDQCAPGTFGFGPGGCSHCECNPVGSLDNFCDANSGQCRCRPNTYGRVCDECQPGFWNFPSCQRCECNGHADQCDPKTGRCLNCRDATDGFNCERCLDSFYGDPRLGVDIPCRACPCPGTIESGHSYANICSLDVQTQDVICECQEGYAGPRCDVCADNYYGNPEEMGGSCRPCQCNNNIDLSKPGNCDGRTGQCQQCLFNTEGFSCEYCQKGYYGQALDQQCTPCVCNLLGTVAAVNGVNECHRETGQCPCLPNVEGLSCDRCITDHWKIASGEGCEPCQCDPLGSLESQCNEFDGQCPCREGFGGRRCDQCRANHWGEPSEDSCSPCDCNEEGSATLQCNHANGTCVCLPGIGGDKCDRCARGYVGTAPHCQPCGECFDNWDRILVELQEQTRSVVVAASEIRESGATGAYTREFESIEQKLQEVASILQEAMSSANQIADLQSFFVDLDTIMRESSSAVEELSLTLTDSKQRGFVLTLAMVELKARMDDMKMVADLLKTNATQLQEADVEGALTLTRQARERVQKAQGRVEFTQQPISDSERQRKRTEALLARSVPQLEEGQQKNANELVALGARLEAMEKSLPVLNKQVCDGSGDPCDSLCGGGGCGKCGAPLCNEGAVNTAELALTEAQKAKETLLGLQSDSEEMIRGVRLAEEEASQSLLLANEALMIAESTNNKSMEFKTRVDELIIKMEKFIDGSETTPDEIKVMAEEVLQKGISLKPEQITDLASRINQTIQSLTNIDVILLETADDLASANALKERADQAKADAEKILDLSQKIFNALTVAEEAQDEAQTAIQAANEDIISTGIHLVQIASETTEAHSKGNASVVEAEMLRERLRDLEWKLKKNDQDAQDAERETKEAGGLAETAAAEANKLEKEYARMLLSLNEAAVTGDAAHDLSSRLQEKTSRLLATANSKFTKLEEMEKEFMQNERRLDDLSDIIMQLDARMTNYLQVISERSDFYRTCQN